MGLETVRLSEVSQRKRNVVWHPLCVEWRKEKIQTYSQNSRRLTDLENELMAARKVGEGVVRGAGIDMYNLLYLKWITSEGLKYSTGKSAQCYVGAGWEGSLGENGYVYVRLILFPVHFKLSQHC